MSRALMLALAVTALGCTAPDAPPGDAPMTEAPTLDAGACASAERMTVLRTPDERFANLPGYPFAPHYVTVDDFECGTLRLHYLDEGPRDGPVIFMLHGNPTWTYLFREVIPRLTAAGYRTIALDYAGMGRSDKPASSDDYSYDRHVAWVAEAFRQLDAPPGLGPIALFGHDYGTPIGARLMAEHQPDRFSAFINANASVPDGTKVSVTHQNWRQFVRENPDVPVGHVLSANVDPPLSQAEIAAWYAPYPDERFKRALQTFPDMVPDTPEEPEAVANRRAWAFLERFERPFMTLFGRFDDPMGGSARMSFIERVPGAFGQPHHQLEVTHYAPEDRPAEVAQAVIDFLGPVFARRLPVRVGQVSAASFATGAGCSVDAASGGLRVAATASCEQRVVVGPEAAALRLAFRFTPGAGRGSRLTISARRLGHWEPVLELAQGVDFTPGAADYALVRLGAAGEVTALRLEATGATMLVPTLALFTEPP
jgi:haloalkane dehalogenase